MTSVDWLWDVTDVLQFSYKTLFTQASYAERVTKPRERLRGRLCLPATQVFVFNQER